MANTTVVTTILGDAHSRLVVKHVSIISDGTQESNTVVYNNSAFTNDVTKGSVLKVYGIGSSCVCRLSWDQTTKFNVVAINPAAGFDVLDFSKFGGITNPGGAGATGNLVLTTSGLAAGSEVTLLVVIRQ
jgi:hypothetical protein